MTAPDLSAGRCVGWPNFTEMDVRQQVQVCRSGCAVIAECAEFGLSTQTTYYVDQKGTGVVFGGMSPSQHRARQQRRQEAR